ncbi:MAG: hypothetical protein JW788_02280 [Candidatus Omnitrophica bacterium]|nr:hypothetical protein [Candidatus Omnitrophota bacterium]
MQQQLSSLEGKMDRLLSRQSQNTPSGERPQQGAPPYRHHNFHSFQSRRHGDFKERRMFQAVCAECGAACEIPFRPTGERPVYCKECFSQRKQGGPQPVKVPAIEKESIPKPDIDHKPGKKKHGVGKKKKGKK